MLYWEAYLLQNNCQDTQNEIQGIGTHFLVHSRAVARNFASSFFKSCNSTVEIEPAAIDRHRTRLTAAISGSNGSSALGLFSLS